MAALETGRTSWTAVLDAVRLGPVDDATTVTADQLRALIDRLIIGGGRAATAGWGVTAPHGVR